MAVDVRVVRAGRLDARPERCAAAGIPPTLRFREEWHIALAHVRAMLNDGFVLTGIVVDAGYGANAQFRAGLEHLGLRYGVAIRSDAKCTTADVWHLDTVAVIADAARPDEWQSTTKGRGERWLLSHITCPLAIPVRFTDMAAQ